MSSEEKDRMDARWNVGKHAKLVTQTWNINMNNNIVEQIRLPALIIPRHVYRNTRHARSDIPDRSNRHTH